MTPSNKSKSVHDFRIGKNLEILSIEENPGRCRTGFIYETRMKNHLQQELFYLIDFNHELDLENMKFIKRKDWDYKTWHFDYAILGIVGNGNHKDEIYEYFNGIYRKQEEEWRK
jgi:hypothetical protein